jgi:CrcB protein
MSAVLLWIGVALVGGCGAVSRFAIHRSVVLRDPNDFPSGTFIVNMLGSFALGLLFGAGAGHDLRLIAGTAFLAAFTTFSTWMFESERLANDGYPRAAVINIALSVGVGLLAVTIGVALGRLL